MLPYRTKPIPSKGVDASGVAVASSVQLRLLSQTLQAGGGVTNARRIISTDTFISSTDGWVGADTTVATVTAKLPLTTEYPNMVVTVALYAGANTFTVVPRGANTIDGAASLVVTTAVTLTPINSTTWHVI